MPNIIINNYCNQKCSYCFANDNMQKSLQKNMSLLTFLKILKYLKSQNDNNVRILGGEPLLSKNIKNFLQISIKGGFNIIIFSNINIPTNLFKEIFKNFSSKDKIRINCNINDREFYKKEEITRIKENMRFAKKQGIELILGYNIINLSNNFEFHIQLAKELGIKTINLKITNSGIGEKLIMDNNDRKLGIWIFNIIKQYYNKFHFSISCGLSKNIFTENEINFIKNNTSINLRFGCSANDGKFDFNTNGKIFKCFPLEKIFQKNIFKKLDIDDILNNKISLIKINKLFSIFFSKGICYAHKKIKFNNLNENHE